jgi:hypothetical protein
MDYRSDCPAQATALKLEQIERLRDTLPSANRVLQRMAGRIPVSLIEEFLERDEALLLEAEHLRDQLADADPGSLDGALAQVLMAERDWLSADPEMRVRAVSMVRRATRYMSAYGMSGTAKVARRDVPTGLALGSEE